ncbi:MAG: hypothetical protein S4CHLAM6_02100 [Chlamydiae bacterium]|nr:hypothetical protein [Chlamydiota bacterium]
MPFTIDGEWVPSEKGSKQKKKITVRTEKRKGRVLTVVSNIQNSEKDQLFKELKAQCHCGGSNQKEHLELQGDHLDKVKRILKQKQQP